jgi:hypothetical protein
VVVLEAERGHPLTVEAITRDDVRAFIADQLDRWKPLKPSGQVESDQLSGGWRGRGYSRWPAPTLLTSLWLGRPARLPIRRAFHVDQLAIEGRFPFPDRPTGWRFGWGGRR